MKHSTVRRNARYIIDSITKILSKVAQNVADFIPFSSKKLLEILIKFFIEKNTLEAKATKNTITICEAPQVQDKLNKEIISSVGSSSAENNMVKEEGLQRMLHQKVVVLESLRLCLLTLWCHIH